ncbi:2',5'-phosphodiesterase 12-like [Sycon ciliatum]|uniref:2',5'-phosphodiesterase 12-like n=1 Tax=Sycon ciliatum TaxID=27933 RepID=UPI0020AA8597|eukprot:scpid44605/ scgid27354/ 2&apos
MAGLFGRLCASCCHRLSSSGYVGLPRVTANSFRFINACADEQNQKARGRIVVRVADGSLFMSMYLDLDGKSRMLNRVRTDAFEKTLHRIGLVSSVVSGNAEYDGDHPVVLVHGSGEKSGQPKEPGIPNIKAFLDGDILSIGEDQYIVSVNPPSVLGISLPTYISKGATVYPSVQAEFVPDNVFTYEWRRIVNQGGNTCEVVVSREEAYTPTLEDVGSSLSLTVTPVVEDSALPASGRTIVSAEVGDDVVRLGYTEFSAHTPEPHAVDSAKLRVVTYNILADMYLTEGFGGSSFSYCDNKALSLGYRDMALSRELPAYHADILCLQEVEEKRFQSTIMSCLRPLSYQGKTVMKHNMPEGIATIWRTDRFLYRDCKTYIVREEFMNNPLLADIYSSVPPWVRSELRNRNSVLQLTHLQQKSDGRELIVANTHLYYSPNADGQRLILALCMVRLLDAFKKAVMEASTASLPLAVVFCGDFNTIPERTVHELMTTGQVAPTSGFKEANRDGLNYECTIPTKFGSSLPHPSVPWTNYTGLFIGMLDYIYYDESVLKLHKLVPMPKEEVVREFTALPSFRFPSDHLPVINDLEFVKS